uniref:Ceroid-lipofuscinosis, neuronal 6 n=1 Tax=Mus musculus TaxID=10090 RepID=D6RE34_MOUSE
MEAATRRRQLLGAAGGPGVAFVQARQGLYYIVLAVLELHL